MKKILSLFLVALMLVGCAATLVACAPKDAGAQINVYLGNRVYDFDPTDYYADSNAEQLMSLLFEPLFKVNAKGKLEKAAAADYDIDKENRKIVVTLRESYWSDDVRVKAEDFAYAWCNRILDPNYPNPAAALLYDIENAAAVKSGNGSVDDIGVKATDVYELEITYREGADVDQLLRNLATVATAPVRQSIVESSPTYWSKNINVMAFNGPFKIRVMNEETSELVLARNLGYHQNPLAKNYDDKVIPDRLVGFVLPAGETMSVSYSDIEDKTVFYLADAPLADRISNKDEAKCYDDASTYSYVFNTKNPLFKSKEVRAALSAAIDREAIINAIAFGKAANGFVPDAFGGSDADLISTKANITLANALLAEADLTGLEKKFTLTINDDEESRAIAQIAKNAWAELGFAVTVEAVTSEEFTVGSDVVTESKIQVLVKEASYGNRDFDVIAVDWQMFSDDAFVGLASMSTVLNGCGAELLGQKTARENISGWSNYDYDNLIASAFKATGEEREALLREAEKLLCEESAVIPLVFNQTFAFASKDLSRLSADAYGNISFTAVKLKGYRKYLED